MRVLRMVVVLLAVLLGGWMTFDGVRALTVGDYVTPSSGPYAGDLGPWAGVVQALGVAPRAMGMKVAFVALGIAWLVAAFLYLRRRRRAESALAALAVALLWYLPVGTVLALLVLAALAMSRPPSVTSQRTRR
jgi:hypothetical protein